MRGPTGFFTHTCILCKRTRLVAIKAASVVFPAKAKTLWLWHKLAFYLEISSLDFLTEEAVPLCCPYCSWCSPLIAPRQLSSVFCCSSFTKWQFSCHLCLSHDPLWPGPNWTRNFPGREFPKESYEEWHNSEQSVKMFFFHLTAALLQFFFFLRQVISSVLVALKCSFLWANSWCILPLIAVSHSSYSAFLLRILLRKRRFNYWEIVYHFCLGILTHSMNMLHSSSFLSSYWKGRNSYPSSLRNY